QVVADAFVTGPDDVFGPDNVTGRVELLLERLHSHVADCHAADTAGGNHIPLQQYRRHGEDIADVVEAVTGVVHRQRGTGVHVERKQITNGIAVFGPVESVCR